MSRSVAVNHALAVSLFSSIVLLGCGGSSGGTGETVLQDFTDTDFDLTTDNTNVTDNPDETLNDILLGSRNELDISYTTLDALPPLQDRLYGGPDFVSIVSGETIGTGEILNSDMVLDIPFTIDGEVTPGLVIEKLYAARSYIRRGFNADGEIFEDGARFRLDLARPNVYAVVTNLSNVDICDLTTGASLKTTMKQGGTVSSNGGLYGDGVSYTNIRREFAETCISAYSSIYMHTSFDTEAFTAFNEGDDFADIEDIESVIVDRLTGFTTAATPLEKGIVTLSYTQTMSPPNSLSIVDEPDGMFAKTLANQSDKSLELQNSSGYVLDPETMLPIARFENYKFPNQDGIFEPGDEVTGPTGATLGDFDILTIDFTPGSSNALMFVNRFLPAE